MNTDLLKPQLKSRNDRVSLNWTQLNAILTGVSAIDINSLSIRTREDARRFAAEYGFNVDDPIDYQHIQQVHREAVEFIEETFLDIDKHHLISPEVRNPENVLDLLVYCSNYLNKSNLVQMWACSVLKVMHGIFHIDHDLKLRYFDHIRGQIFDSLDKLFESSGADFYLTDGTLRLPLYFFTKKRNKGRRSILLKLLQKPTYVAADIYDHLGLRLIFETKVECLFALQILRRSHLINVTNIKPFRSRNNLVDLKYAKELFAAYRPMLERAQEYPSDVLKRLDAELSKGKHLGRRDTNPHSSSDFQTIQVTARKMVRVPNQAVRGMEQMAALLREKGLEVPPEMEYTMERERDTAFYFDYEIQILDKTSYLKTMHGPASHDAYKKRQIETAMKRVLSPALRKYLAKETQLAAAET